MNCQEVIELMQRNLDKDLSDFENESMNRHVQGCSSCSLMFQRLQRLSSELENLPKVMPKYDLVDSIMPKLDHIDRLRSEGKAEDRSFSPEVVEKPSAKKKKDRFSWGVMGGIVAAGIMLGLFMMHQPQSILQNADGRFASGSSSASSAENHALSGDSAKLAQPNSDSKSSTESSDKAKKEEKFQAFSAADNGSPTPSQNSRQSSPSGGGQAAGSEMQSQQSPAAEKQNTNQNQADLQMDANIAPKNQSGVGTTASPNLEEAPTASGDLSAEKPKIMMGIAAAPAEKQSASVLSQSLASPDGTWTAEIYTVPEGIQVVIKDKSGAAVYTSSVYQADQLSNLVWSHEGKWLEFDLTTGESKSHIVIDAAQKAQQ